MTSLHLNKGSVNSASTLWEAFKTTIRGICISTTAGILKDIRMQLQQSEQRIKKLETEYDNTHNAQTLSEIRKEITNYNTLADEEIKYNISHNDIQHAR